MTNSYSLLGNVIPATPDAVWTWWDIGCTPPTGSIYQGPNCGVAGNPVASPKYISTGPNTATTLDDCYFNCLHIPGCVAMIMEAGKCNTFDLPPFPDLVPAANGPWVYYDAVCFTANKCLPFPERDPSPRNGIPSLRECCSISLPP